MSGLGLTGPFALTNAYQADAKRVAEQQAALAGIRLAKLIDTSQR